MDPDSCALNADGTLKDARDIEWDYSPTQNRVSIPQTVPPSPTVPLWSSFTFGTQLTPASFGTAQKRKNPSEDPDNSKSATRPATNSIFKSKPSARQNGKGDAGGPKVKSNTSKPAAVERVKALQSQNSASNQSESDGDDDDEDNRPKKKKRKKGDGAADILTVFKPVNPDDVAEGYECQVCMWVLGTFEILGCTSTNNSPVLFQSQEN